MKKSIIILFSITISLKAFSLCVNDSPKEYLEFSSINQLSLSTSKVIKKSTCDNISGESNIDKLKDEINNIVQNQTNSFDWKNKNRHQVGVMLNQCTPVKTSKALVITFAGTTAYNPRTYSLMSELIKCENYQKLPEWMKKSTYSLVIKSLKSKKSSYTKWSGIEKGPMNLFISDPELNKHAKNFDYTSFASEESEIIADTNKMKSYNPASIIKEFTTSTAGMPRGIKEAYNCTKKYFKAAKELGIKPKLIVMSHSSGGRSAVKYLEQIKNYDKNLEASLVFTIDPVKEAHEAIKEVAGQKASNTVDDYNPFTDNKHKAPKVWSRKQPKSLYKTSNTKRWINLYQNKDKVSGDAGFMKFGIAGSPIHNADANYFINDKLGKKPHGGITYHEKTLNVLKKEIDALF